MMQPLLANAGVPMVFVQMPFLLITLPVIIAVEAFLCRRWFAVPWRRSWIWSGVANLVSTVLGFPILWIALVAVQMLVGGGSAPPLSEPWFSVYTVTVQAAWLLPFEDRFHWMIPTACLVLLVPSFFVTVFVEKLIYRRAFRECHGSVGVTSATWKMHCISYGLVVAAGLGLLISSVAGNRTASDNRGNRGQSVRSERGETSSTAGAPQ
jgi:hypothetical protein